jgi:hypothetical protein
MAALAAGLAGALMLSGATVGGSTRIMPVPIL